MTSRHINLAFIILLIIHIGALIFFINNSYTDGWNLRQAQTAMMARNIAFDGFNFLPTRLDFFAPYSGEVILEFPLIHSMTAILYSYFGEEETYGRLLNMFFHSLNILIVYKTLQILFSNFTTKIFTLIYCFTPIIFYSAHAFIPETSMLFFYLMAFYLFLLSDLKDLKINIPYRLTLSILPLIKPIGGVIYFPILFNAIYKGKKAFMKEAFALGLCSIPFISWVFFASVINSDFHNTGGDWANWSDILLGRGGVFGNWVNIEFYKNVLTSLIFLNATPLIILFCIFVLSMRINFPMKKFINIWAISNIVILMLFAGANRGHPYYQIYFVPIFLVYAAAYFDHFIKNNNAFKIRNLVSILLLTHLSISLTVYMYGANENSRISNLDEFIEVANQGIDIETKSPESFVIIQTENLTSGVYDFYLNQYTQQFSLKHHDNPISHLSNQIDNGARYIFIINTSYGKSIDISMNDKEYWNWLNNNSSILYKSESIILFELN